MNVTDNTLHLLLKPYTLEKVVQIFQAKAFTSTSAVCFIDFNTYKALLTITYN